MADYIGFNEGQQQVGDTGWPATVTFALSTSSVGGVGGSTAFAATTVHASFGEITGTGYARASQSEPAATALGRKLFTQMAWATGSAVNWPNNVRSIVALDNTTTKLICAWNLIAGGAVRDMSAANTTLNVTPDHAPTNPV